MAINSTPRRFPQLWIKLALLSLAVGMPAGCDGCGFPSFVKITPDSRYIVYQDAWYPKAYVYDTAAKEKTVYDGHFACMDASVSRVILRGPVADGLMPCWVVEFGDDGPTRTPLPAVPMGDCRDARIILDEGGFIAALMEYKWSREPLRAMRLDSGAEQWVDLPAVPDLSDEHQSWRYDEPFIDRRTRHLYTHTPSGPPIPGDLDSQKGVDVESFLENNELGYKLTSPDGSYFVTIIDPQDIWRRLWLTDVATRERTMLLDKNNAGAVFLKRAAGLPGALLIAPFAPF